MIPDWVRFRAASTTLVLYSGNPACDVTPEQEPTPLSMAP